MRFAVHLVNPSPGQPPGSAAANLRALGAACDDAGVDVLSLPDHFFGLPYLGGVDSPMLEGYTTLGFLAGVTTRVQLQLLVTGVTYRHPGVLAQTLATLDVLSDGRAIAGLGAAWYEREHLGLGVAFPPLRDRFVMLEETCQILAQMWSADDGPFEGTYYQLAETRCNPAPLHEIPVMIGGVGERKALRLVAAYADACNFFAGGESGPEFIAQKLAVLHQHCDEVGRDFDEIARTILWTPDLDPRDGRFVEQMAQMATLGVQEVHVAHHGEDPAGFVAQLSGLVARVHEL